MDLKFTPDSYGGIALAEAYWIKGLTQAVVLNSA